MSVIKIEEYRQQNGDDILKVILKPTKGFPIGYFYTNSNALDLVNNFCWRLGKDTNTVVVECFEHLGKKYRRRSFHQELYNLYNNYYAPMIDHVNMVDFDNVINNINSVSLSQNKRNEFRKGYSIIETYNKEGRQYYCRVNVAINRKIQLPYGTDRHLNEDMACILQHKAESIWLKEQLGDDWYMFDFKKYRRGSEDILDLERTGQISEEEATYRHILKYSDNAWYMLRYGLEDYYKENNIPIPQYLLDYNGFMIHPITGQRLCPFK